MNDATLRAAVVGLGAIGAGGSVFSGVQERKQRRGEAGEAKELAATAASEWRREGARLRASQRVAFAASGVDPGAGTSLDVQAQSARDAELDALSLQMQGDREARRSKALGTTALTRGLLGGAGTTLSTIDIFKRI
jgi:hypothetical protein